MNNVMTPLGSIELVIFDCDGVIADSEILAIRALTKHLTALGVALDEGFVAKQIVGKSFSALSEVVKDQLDTILPEDFEDRYWASLAVDFLSELKTTPGFLNVLSALNSAYCLASNSNSQRVRKTLEILNLEAEFCDYVFTSSHVSRGKPAPDLHKLAAKTMGVDPKNVLVIEDSSAGIEAARAAGMQVWRYVGASHFSASQRRDFLDTSEVPVFESWSRFFELAPDLKKRA